MSRIKKDVGDWGEEMAVAFLRRQKFEILGRNFHTVFGEIDIVAKTGDDYYFIEVKTRPKGEWASDLAITAEKKRRLWKSVKSYCYRYNIGDDVGIILAGLIVAFDRSEKKVDFRLVVLEE